MSAINEHTQPDGSGPPWNVLVGSGGRLVIPADARSHLGIKPGDMVRMRLDGGNLVVTTPASAIRWLRGLARAGGPREVDPVVELTAERRREAQRELDDA